MRTHNPLDSVIAASVLAALAITAVPASAETLSVSTGDELLSALGAAVAGDVVELGDGTYVFGGASCSADGNAAAPIVVRAAHPGAAIVQLDSLEGFVVSGAQWHFEDLVIEGVCAADDDCEHAFHVVGAAHGFQLRRSVVRDFNAQLKVNAQAVDGTPTAPDDGLIEGCEIYDTRARQTANPVTKLNIDGGQRWVVRDTYLHDFHKDGGNTISYGAFMKSGGGQGLFERNLVVCDSGASVGGARIGLSFGGGGTAPQFCAPGYDANIPCDVEHQGGVLRNNIIANCSDVGIYLNRASNTQVLFNTLVATSGVDFRFDTSSGRAHGNLLAGVIRDRDGGAHTAGDNREGVSAGEFQAWYTAPSDGDLSLAGEVASLVGAAAADPQVSEDYCARQRGAGPHTLGALEHSLGSCATVPPPGGGSAGGGGAGAGGSSGSSAGGGAHAGGASGGDGGASSNAAAGGSATPGAGDEAGCSCRAGGGGDAPGWLLVAVAAAFVCRQRRRRPAG